jgi:hypothetical protein
MNAILLCAIATHAFATTPATAVTLEDAIQKKMVVYQAEGNDKSTHYLMPLVLNVTNKINEKQKIQINPGLTFNPENEAYQQMVTTKTLYITLAPGETKQVEVYAMCTQPGNRGQQSGIYYQLTNTADTKLKEMATFIDQHNLQRIEAQYAVWAVSANESLENIAGYDDAAVNTLLPFVANLLNKPIPPKPADNDYKRNYAHSGKHMKVEVGGAFRFSYPVTKNISIAMFNKNNTVERELYFNPAVPPGSHEVKYAFDATVYTDEYYYIRMIVDEVIKINDKVELN